MQGKQAVHVPGISEGPIAKRVPISPAAKANGFVFVSGMPPMDLKTGEFVKGDIAKQTRYALEAVKHVLTRAGSSMDKVVGSWPMEFDIEIECIALE
jgi:2-iminobutanoate/2-iminopropanoate deaminase